MGCKVFVKLNIYFSLSSERMDD